MKNKKLFAAVMSAVLLGTAVLGSTVAYADPASDQDTYVTESTDSITTYGTFEWNSQEAHYSYYDESHNIVKGWFVFENEWYYADEKGVLPENTFLEENGYTYYLIHQGKMLYNSEYYDIYMKASILTDEKGHVTYIMRYENGETYYYDLNEQLVNGWMYNIDRRGNWSYAIDGKLQKNKWVASGGKWYYMDNIGRMVKDTTYYIENGNYYFDANGVMQTGWVKLYDNWEKEYFWYYYSSSGRKQNKCWLASGGKWYYLKSGGEMATNWCYVDDSYYFFESNGAMKTGWVSWNGYWYYMYSNGKMATNTVLTINGKKYAFNSNGIMKANGYYTLNITGEYKPYYIDKNGVIGASYDFMKEYDAYGWVNVNGDWYYYTKKGNRNTYQLGTCATGWNKIGGVWYYFNQWGEMMTDFRTINSKTYYFDKSGAMLTGWQYLPSYLESKENPKYKNWYYFDANGVKAQNKWVASGGKWYYMNANGNMVKDDIVSINGESHEFDKDGVWLGQR